MLGIKIFAVIVIIGAIALVIWAVVSIIRAMKIVGGGIEDGINKSNHFGGEQ